MSHWVVRKWMANEIKRVVMENYSELNKMTPEDRCAARIEKFVAMGVVKD